MMEQQYKPIESTQHTSSDVNIKQIIEKYLYYWKWFVIGILLAIGIAYTYLRYAERQYVASAQILLTDAVANAPELQMLSDIGMQQPNAAVIDQIRLMKSRRILMKVVDQTGTNIRYITKGKVKNVELFSNTSPIQLKFANDSLQFSANMEGKLVLKSTNSTEFTVIESSFVKPGTYSFGEIINSKLGAVSLQRFSNETISELEILCIPSLRIANSLMNRIQVVPGKENSSKFVDISLVDPVKERAQLIINTLIQVYNEEMIDDSNRIAIATSNFISKRLQIISDDLKGVDKELAGYKSQNNINLSVEEAGMYLSEASTADKEVIHINTQLQVAQHLVTTLKNQQNILLPSSVGIEDSALNTAINNYNQLVLEKQEYTKTMGAVNPALQTINKNLADLKENIQNSLGLYQNNLRIALKAAEQTKSRFEARLDRVPAQELGFRNIVRQQQIVESVYLNLLQKREEAEIRVSATTDAVKVIDYAYTNPTPVAPKPLMIYAFALGLGLFLPFAYVFIKLLFNNKVKDKKDVQHAYSGAY